jgi:uncharacterized membrane-anchored protein
MSDRKVMLLFALAVALQVLILAGIPAQRIWVLSTGRTLEMEIVPVDPYNVLSGYYARLGYSISDPASFPSHEALEDGDTVYAVMERDADGSWRPLEIMEELPRGLTPDRIALKGSVDKSSWRTRIHYGIETFYVPETDRQGVEQGLRSRGEEGDPPVDPSIAIIKVDAHGRAAIVSIRVAGRTYD